MKARWLAVGLIAALGVFAIAPVSAHEGREVGEYLIEFGWRAEPAYAGLFNGPEVYLALHDDDEAPFPADVAVTLQAEVTFGPETMTIPLEVARGETGHYVGDLLPTLPGDYSFRITGTIGDTAVDETFSSANGEFSSVQPLSDIQFPQAGAADTAALLARIDALEARVAELEAAAGS